MTGLCGLFSIVIMQISLFTSDSARPGLDCHEMLKA